MSETGVVKFHCEHAKLPLAPFAGMKELNDCRKSLVRLGLLGIDQNGIGFGNLSLRAGLMSDFYITGSGTGGLPELKIDHYAKVSGYDFAQNWISCEGAIVTSSESLTHAAIYAADPQTRAIIHGHSAILWERLRGVVPTTESGIEYGTPAMAEEVQRLINKAGAKEQKIFVMGGHENGVIAFGETPDAVLAVIRFKLSELSP